MNGDHPTGLLDLPGEALALLAEAVLALRTTGDLGVSWGIASASATRALGASDARMLRVDPRSGAMFRCEESGVEMPYLAEHGGPVEWVMRHDRPLFDEGRGDPRAPRETLLWQQAPAALATLPLVASNTHFGFLLLAFGGSRDFSNAERLFSQTLADALALALERADLTAQLDHERVHVSAAERALATAQDSASRLMAIVAHELRSPLSSIKAYAESLAGNLDNPSAPRERFLEVINEECDRLSALVTNVHDLSRIESGECTLRLGHVPLADLGRDVCMRLADAAGKRDVTLALETTGDARVEVDLDLARRVIGNLIQNAIEFSPEGGTVSVKLSPRGDEWTCCVTDQGPKLPAEDLAHVFEGFYRARRQLPDGRPSHEGTRIGLAIARSIARLHGGQMWAEQPEAGGASFWIALPLRQLASARARRIARQTVGRDDLKRLFDAIVDLVAASLEAGIVSLVLVDPDRGDLFVAAAQGLEPVGANGRRTTLRSGVAGAVAAWGRPVLVENIETDRRFKRLNHPQYQTKSLLCVPLRVEDEVIGVINANNKASGEPFDDDDLALLVMLTERVSSIIERACAYPDSARVVEDALEALRCMTRLKRELSLGGRALVKHARAVARELGMSPSDVDVIGYVASIHDLGMVRLAAETAHPGRLDDAQRNALSAHPEVSVEILRPIEYLGVVREYILGHHERWDGTGYPRGSSGESIPLGSRILAVVDAWESMTTARPYRAARSAANAVSELRREAGRQFDGQVVEAFLRVLAREGDLPAAA
ncbi:MAG TPA: HD domain-containing phosphohydrolase [Candidatus Acidoferrales bacterium]|nr:HD domain-containing phosphohydrolase [Candidatus Acidoferrales bacterium]